MIKTGISLLCKSLAVSVFMGIFFFGNTQTVAKGTVFLDKNQNGKKESSEKGISEVAVSNGSDVVLTDANGSYELPVEGDAIIFVITPTDYKVSKGKNSSSKFYYIYKPDGSPEAKYKGVEPTGKLPKKIDFGLVKQDENEDYTALIFGDPQPRNLDELKYFEKSVVQDIDKNTEIAYGISLGDLVWNDLSLFEPYKKSIAALNIPWYDVMGNHDMNLDAKNEDDSDETFEAHFGPATYSYNYAKTHILILDDILYPDPRDGKGYWGGFTEKQLKFIENDLKLVPKDYLVVLNFHIPISEPEGDSFRDEDRNNLFEILKDFPNTLSISAHTHIQRQDFFSAEDGWKGKGLHHHFNAGTTCGDWNSGKFVDGIPKADMRDGTPRGYAFLKVKGNQYVIDYKVAGENEDYQIKLFVPKVMKQGQYSKAGIYANFFMGSKSDEVFFRVDKGDWKKMDYIEDHDPNYSNMVYDWDLSDTLIDGIRPSNPIDSKHLWHARIPTKIENGEHLIEVKATDMFGQVHMAEASYRLE
ncbi:MAG: calcineurin-like phosphoesterase C-terminal domain-containing protein [Christiangramia sp.]|uniref:calcineurin-like phosphoesterase C-terminal domain-containing protein n=1 Tax=Christiangramia sp. TaxID=1931228 RepID=UPI00324250E6